MDLDFLDLPPFPDDVPKAPLLRIQLSKLIQGDQGEIDKLWKASCELGFFYLDLRGASSNQESISKSSTANNFADRTVEDVGRADSATGDIECDDRTQALNPKKFEIDIDGERLLQDAKDLFSIGKEIFDLPVKEKTKYDLKDKGSYFGYKGYGQGIIDAKGTKDRNEFYNVRDIKLSRTAGAHIRFRYPKMTF